jgi:L-ascorbate metabolism protein UlaG (beta-lactamase superfamily)
MSSKQFGGKITPEWKSKYQASPNWKNGTFHNLMETQTALNWRILPTIIYKQIKGHKEGQPKSLLPVAPFNAERFYSQANSAKLIWYGHSVMLLALNGKTILIDPMFGPDASPIGPKRTQRFSENTLALIDDLPPIDLMLLTHDHYDHLDFASITRLIPKIKQAFVAFGAKRHLMHWGVNEAIIQEFDWWDSKSFHDIQITFTPTRHFSGRGLTSMAKCLWGGWALKTPQENIWFSGDGGYSNHFKEIGKRLGPFDLGIMECGQYCPDWAQIHLFPNESVQAAVDAKVKTAMPIHWAGFNLSYHHAWYEPAHEFIKYAQQKQLHYITPDLGQVFDNQSISHAWWEKF